MNTTAVPPAAELIRPAGSPEFDVSRIRDDFPFFSRDPEGRRAVYLDSAATCQKPRVVIEAIVRYYRDQCSNVHRGAHRLAELATDAFESARRKVQRLINAEHFEEIVFVSGATEGINLVAECFGRKELRPGDEIIISQMEHHSNLLPWQVLRDRTGVKLRVVPMDDEGEFLLEEYEKLLGPRTKLVALTHVSNALGTITPVERIVQMAHQRGALVLIDGAQAVPHLRVDVQDMGCDFYTFSGHKLFGPTGIGVLYGKKEALDRLPPYRVGGGMIRSVSVDRTVYADLPHKFEAGTPNIAGAIGMGAAVDYLDSVGIEAAAAHESELLTIATGTLRRIPGVRLIGTAKHKAPIVSFIVDGIHAHDVSTILDAEGVMVRAGHHCAQPVMDRFGVPAVTRASLAFYNTEEDVAVLARGIHKVKEMFR